MKFKTKKSFELYFSCNLILPILVIIFLSCTTKNEPSTAVIAYTGQSSWSKYFSPSFITVTANDGITNVNTVERRVANLREAGVDVEYRRYERAGHGFGLGTGTDAEGWLDLAVRFWQRHITVLEPEKVSG